MLSFIKHIFTNLGIDLGTANTVVFTDTKGFVVNQSSVIAYNSSNDVIAFGNEAKEMLGKTGELIRVIRPLADGVIADFEAGEELVKSFIRSADVPKYRIGKVVMGVPTGITEVEKIAVIESAEQSGAREVYLIAEPMAAAIGIGLDVMGKDAHMIVDIGGGTTDIAVITYGGIVIDNTIRVAGDELNESVVRYFKNKYNMRIGESTAERLKIEFGTVTEKYNGKAVTVKGLDVQTGLPRQLILSSSFFIEALQDVTDIIIAAIMSTLEKLPPELVNDLVDRGIILTGGGAMLRGLDDIIREKTSLPVNVADNALFSVAEGTRLILEDFKSYRKMLMNR
jgi:rod shape-determining protein MreB and related proteins